jgi:hypothetical protein
MVDSGMGSHPEIAGEVAPDMDSSLATVEEAGPDKKDTQKHLEVVDPALDSFPAKGQQELKAYNNSLGGKHTVAAGWDSIPGAGMSVELDKDTPLVTAALVALDSNWERPLPDKTYFHCRRHSLGAMGFPEFLHMMTLPVSQLRLTNNIQLRMTVEGSY